MIFLSVGSELPFSRLVKAVDEWGRENSELDIVAQVGKLSEQDYVPLHSEHHDFVDPTKYSQLAEASVLMIAHAGMGSIISAMTIGKPLVIMPRRAELREATTDHQCATAKKFEGKEGIFVAWDESEIGQAISNALEYAKQAQFKRAEKFAPEDFIRRIRSFIVEA
ncbi:hypothetical protein F0M18_12835 [Pseudohalioglobus sediminis]|uniref:Glycosyl transferase family 28 C-terminal domain-containing protein n=1 Tax=Pseudohalioglobus sediminis TaxID=2606449 RepID=A0A5B0WSF8_9GAMM|nr:glycosyltransferase [Pseudohalioglobus sediminis]KAA1189954.1 hypothetical protein F0M18_12835 [Pseudohalioglobus sediminis]